MTFRRKSERKANPLAPLPPRYLPTQAEIADACRAIQSTWSEEEREERRTAVRPVPWEVPFAVNVHDRDLRDA